MKKTMMGILMVATAVFGADGAEIYKAKCFSCHGDKAIKPALNKSQVIAGWDATRTIASVKGYTKGEGGAMKNIMKPIAAGLSEEDLKAVAETIASFK